MLFSFENRLIEAIKNCGEKTNPSHLIFLEMINSIKLLAMKGETKDDFLLLQIILG